MPVQLDFILRRFVRQDARQRCAGAVRRGQRRGLRGARADAFLHGAQHPTLGRGYLGCAYAPMVELLGLLAANDFASYIVSGGGRDFMRPIGQKVYGIPRERVIGSATALAYTSDERGGTITHTPAPDSLDDGPEKPIR